MFYSPQGTDSSTGLVDSRARGNGPSATHGATHPAVLIVDDDADSRILLSFIFEQFPCSVVTESSGEAALERINRMRFDLVMLDIQLPGMSGLDFLGRLRVNPLNAFLPVIAVTALARQQDQEEALLAGCDRYISKPYLIEDIERLISQYIKKR